MENRLKLDIETLSRQLAQGELTSQALVEAALERINALNPKLNAFITVAADQALSQAKAVDQALQAGKILPALAGLPIAVKDVLITKNTTTTAGSRILSNYRPTYDATAVQKLKEQQAIVIGKTNCDEFAMGASGEYSSFGPTRNPWDLERVTGGSSSGSAAAVSADLCTAALGTDTGGSVRQPASFTNLVGLKPTYGRVSRRGLIAMTSSTDTVGILARTVRDAAYILKAITGYDSHDATSVQMAVPDYRQSLEPSRRRVTLGVPAEYFPEGMDKEVAACVNEAIKAISRFGVDVVEVSLPHTAASLPTYYLINPAEVSSNLARYDGLRYGQSALTSEFTGELGAVMEQSRDRGLGAEVKRRIMLGTFALSRGYADRYYLRAQRIRTLVRQDFDNAFGQVDYLLTPTTPDVAWPLGAVVDPLTMYLADINLTAVSLAGLPALSLPCGFVRGLPVGLQIIGRAFDEAGLLGLAQQYEQTARWTESVPKLDG